MMVLRRRFLAEGQEKSRQLLLEMDGQFSANDAAKAVHNGSAPAACWATRPSAAWRAKWRRRCSSGRSTTPSFAIPSPTWPWPSTARARPATRPFPEQIVKTLSGKRVVAVGFPANEAQRLSVALERAQRDPRCLWISPSRPIPGGRSIANWRRCTSTPKPPARAGWTRPHAREDRPVVFVGLATICCRSTTPFNPWHANF